MQVAILVPETEWRTLLATVGKLEAAHVAAQATAPPPDEILTVRQAAALLGLSTEAIRRARRAGRINGVRRNERDWGFYRSVVEQYPRRYQRSAP